MKKVIVAVTLVLVIVLIFLATQMDWRSPNEKFCDNVGKVLQQKINGNVSNSVNEIVLKQLTENTIRLSEDNEDVSKMRVCECRVNYENSFLPDKMNLVYYEYSKDYEQLIEQQINQMITNRSIKIEQGTDFVYEDYESLFGILLYGNNFTLRLSYSPYDKNKTMSKDTLESLAREIKKVADAE